MPIDIDEFEAADPESLTEGDPPVRESVLAFLAYNPERAYSREEIQSALDVDAIALLYELSALERDGLVRHKGRYWTVTDADGGDE